MIIRSLLLLLPLSIWSYLFINPKLDRRQITASFLGFAWAFHACLIVNLVFLKWGLLNMSITDNLFYGIPLDWIFSQAIIIGALVPLTRLLGWKIGFRLLAHLIAFIMIYYAAGMKFSNPNTGIIILVSTLLCAIPAMALSDWTANDTKINARSVLQSLAWATLLLWLFPSTVFYLTTDSWNLVLRRDMQINALYFLPLLIPAYLLISALYQFAIEGNGTAFPYDPPKRLVTGGIYQYISNPMQLGICLLMAWWGVVLQSVWITASALIAIILFMVFKDICNGSCAIGKGNTDWDAYQTAVPKWLPRLTPYVSE